MFYNYRAMVENLDYNVVAEAMAQDLSELGFDRSVLNLQQTIPNMDTVLKIFLTPQDYQRVRQELNEFMKENSLSPLDQDFLTDKPADKSMSVNLFPVTEHFELAEPGDFADLPEHEKPKPHGYAELESLMSRSMSSLIVGDEIRFRVSENDYKHHMDKAIHGIKESIIATLKQVIGVVLPDVPHQPQDLVPILRETLGPEAASPIAKWINSYATAY